MRTLLAHLAALAICAAPLASPAQALKSDEDKTLYALGAVLGRNVHPIGLSAEELAKVRAGFEDAAAGRKLQVDLDTFGPKVSPLAQRRAAEVAGKQAVKEREAAKGFLEKAAKEPGADKLPSGLIYRTLKAGAGAQPSAASTVKVHYEGKLLDGTVFDSSRKRGEPATFPLTGVIKCWTEGVARMKEGELARLICPSEIAYGDHGSPPKIPGGATLVFEVELLHVEGPPSPPPELKAPVAKAPEAPPVTAPAKGSGCGVAGAPALLAVAGLLALVRRRRAIPTTGRA